VVRVEGEIKQAIGEVGGQLRCWLEAEVHVAACQRVGFSGGIGYFKSLLVVAE